MIPDTPLKNLLKKFTKYLQEETELQGLGAQLGSGRPVQLVRLDEEGGLILDKEALRRCLEQGGVRDAPVCLVSIIGEQRWGRSFLLNYLLRRLRSPGTSDGSWMGREDEPLEGFEWRVGNQRVTKGVWVWNQTFWVPAKGKKVAVLLVDTEGSMDIERNKETSIKLSAMSMLLSSYQILNIGRRVKDPDLEYLEMSLHVAEVVGEAYGLKPVQHLDLLVRDWSSSQDLGAEGGEQHLRDVRQMLEATSPCKHPKTLEVLSRSSTRCYLMPFPGKRISTGSEGTLRDMDEDFRDSLRDYVTALVGSAGRHIRKDQHGELLTGTQLAARIENLSDVMKKHRFGFSSPCQMAITFHNQRVLDRARSDHALFLKEKVDPSTMVKQLAEKRRSLLGRCREEMKEPEETLLTALEAELTREAETFLETYRRRYQCHANNQRPMDRARRDHSAFLREKDGLSQRMDDCLKMDPRAMLKQLTEKRRSLLGRCREEMEEPEETLLTALEAELTREAKTFVVTYRRRYQCHANQRLMDRARRDHAAFLGEKDGLSQRMVDCLKMDPSAMLKQLAEQRRSLLGWCRKEMKEPAETLLTALEAELTREAETFLETYRRRYQCHTINQRVMERARRDHADLLREKDGLSQRVVDCLKMDPGAMAEQLAEQQRSLLGRCRKEMKEPEETLLTALEAELTREAETFVETYRRRYQCHTINQRVMDRARRDHAAFLREKDGLSQRVVDCLKMDPGAMVKQLVEQRRSLLGWCREEMEEPEETLLTALEAELTREAETFLETYRRRYQCHAINQRVMDSARRDHAAFLREKDGLSQRMVDCLKMDPSAMLKQLAEQRRSLLGRCREEMKEPEETLLTALEEELTREAETFLETYRRRYQCHAINQRVMDRARRDHADLLRENDGLSQRVVDCLKMDPGAMAEQLAEQRRSLLGRCRKEMKEPAETLLTALEAELTREAETFLESYRRRYQCHTINQRVMERARRDHADLLREKDGLSQRMVDCLKMDPSAMLKQLTEQHRSLLGRCREEMKEPEETLLTALEEELTREAETFLETYRRRYQCHANNQRPMDRARRDHALFLREKDGLSQRMDDCLKVDPSAMEQQLVEQRRSLLGRCREEMKEPAETLLTALEAELTREAETFLETYRRHYQCHANQRVMDRARRDHAAFLREKDVLSQRMDDCLKMDPSAMLKQLTEQHRSLLGRCREEMEEPEETLLTALEAELTREAETFLETYRRRYQCHTINQRPMERARRDHADLLREKVSLWGSVPQPGEPQRNSLVTSMGFKVLGRRREFISPAPRVAAEMGDSNPCPIRALISVWRVRGSCCAVARGTIGETVSHTRPF
ncbi:uncharacterized protein LOC135982830 isoform X2 [Chrysemys picta bellii]|uniref:uncharacterized protein LOC135982830 isoform X2 n=1 Tax=Chrysemys picta bellii TaxID=8478 RepID=UPI0032B1BBA0